MNKGELLQLHKELDLLSERCRRWASNLGINMGTTYGIKSGSVDSRKFEEIGVSVQAASISLAEAAIHAAELVDGKHVKTRQS